MFSSSSTSFQTGLFINGNKLMSYLKEQGESGIHSPLFKGSPDGKTSASQIPIFLDC